MDISRLWQIILWLSVVMCVVAFIMTVIPKRDSDIEETVVNIFKDISTVIIIPIILEFLQSSKKTSGDLVSLILFTIIIVWCNIWPLIKKREKTKVLRNFFGKSYTELYINSDKVKAIRYDKNNESEGTKE